MSICGILFAAATAVTYKAESSPAGGARKHRLARSHPKHDHFSASG
jgi:hypothetical protein